MNLFLFKLINFSKSGFPISHELAHAVTCKLPFIAYIHVELPFTLNS